jgi:uncharacterized protein YbjT (DUF2867 family)
VGLRIFVADATGVIGRSLIPQFLRAGHIVAGTTRTADGAGRLRAVGIEPTVTDVFDAEALTKAVVTAGNVSLPITGA